MWDATGRYTRQYSKLGILLSGLYPPSQHHVTQSRNTEPQLRLSQRVQTLKNSPSSLCTTLHLHPLLVVVLNAFCYLLLNIQTHMLVHPVSCLSLTDGLPHHHPLLCASASFLRLIIRWKHPIAFPRTLFFPLLSARIPVCSHQYQHLLCASWRSYFTPLAEGRHNTQRTGRLRSHLIMITSLCN